MKKGKRTLLVALVGLMALFALACPKRTSIGEIESDPSRFNNKTVAVAGEVKTSYGLDIPFYKDDYGFYKVDDGTGTIWVATKKSVPTRGALLGVKGKVRKGLVFNGKNYGLILFEDDRRFKKK